MKQMFLSQRLCVPGCSISHKLGSLQSCWTSVSLSGEESIALRFSHISNQIKQLLRFTFHCICKLDCHYITQVRTSKNTFHLFQIFISIVYLTHQDTLLPHSYCSLPMMPFSSSFVPVSLTSSTSRIPLPAAMPQNLSLSAHLHI